MPGSPCIRNDGIKWLMLYFIALHLLFWHIEMKNHYFSSTVPQIYRPEQTNLQFSLCDTQKSDLAILRRSKTVILLILKDPNFDFWENSASKTVENSQIFTFETHTFYVKSNLTIFRRSKTAFLVILEALPPQFWFFRKFRIWKWWNYQNC